MDYSMYEAILTRRMWLYGIICAIFAIGLLICLFLNAHTGSGNSKSSSPRKRIEDKIIQWVLYILGVTGLVVCIGLGSSTVWKCTEDIKNQSYNVWEGDITVITHGPTGGIWYLPDEGGIKLEGEGLGEGKYSGKVIYAENSGVVLEYWIEDAS